MEKPNVNESIKQNYELVARAPTTEKVGQVTTIRHAIAIDVARTGKIPLAQKSDKIVAINLIGDVKRL